MKDSLGWKWIDSDKTERGRRTIIDKEKKLLLKFETRQNLFNIPRPNIKSERFDMD